MYFLMQWGIRELVGTNEVLLRLPSFLALGLGTLRPVPLGKLLFDAETGLLPGVVFASTGSVAFAAADARPYALALTALISATHVLVRWLDRGRWRDAGIRSAGHAHHLPALPVRGHAARPCRLRRLPGQRRCRGPEEPGRDEHLGSGNVSASRGRSFRITARAKGNLTFPPHLTFARAAPGARPPGARGGTAHGSGGDRVGVPAAVPAAPLGSRCPAARVPVDDPPAPRALRGLPPGARLTVRGSIRVLLQSGGGSRCGVGGAVNGVRAGQAAHGHRCRGRSSHIRPYVRAAQPPPY